MRFGLFYELQLPRPWAEDSEQRLVDEAIEQCILAEKLGVDYAWSVEHHFLEEYSHNSASEAFLAAIAARTERIKIGFGIRQVIPNYNHPARTAEAVSMVDLISHGRVQFGIGEGATRLEIGGFAIDAKRKRDMSLESAREVANMMVMDPYPGYKCADWELPCRNVLPKPVQKPHPPMWMACTNRDTIKVAARNGLGALAFSFIDPEEAKKWSKIYYDTIRSEECVPLGHSVNPNIAMISPFSIHDDEEEAKRRGLNGFRFFEYAVGAIVTQDMIPGHTTLWEDFDARLKQGKTGPTAVYGGEVPDPKQSFDKSPGIGTPDQFREHMREFAEVGLDQVIFMQQCGKNKHEHICESLQYFHDKVLDDFVTGREEREARKAEELAPYIEAAMARKQIREPLAREEVPIVPAARQAPKLPERQA